jgi:hypothetical protein
MGKVAGWIVAPQNPRAATTIAPTAQRVAERRFVENSVPSACGDELPAGGLASSLEGVGSSERGLELDDIGLSSSAALLFMYAMWSPPEMLDIRH